MSTLSLAEGVVFNGRYRVVRCIAMGGMGAVYEVIHQETERRRALKVMLPHLVQNDEMRTRFRQEAKVAGRVDSDFIVDVFDAGIDEATGMPFLVMELLRGEELAAMLQRVGRLSAAETVTYLYQAALALDKTHQVHIVHRDLKPANLFIEQREGRAPRVKVLDFGIAKLIADSTTQANATRNMGTPLFMAPEQFQLNTPISSASDIYALGMVAYNLLTGHPYWEEEASGANSVFAFAAIACHGPRESAVARAERHGARLPAAFDGWFARMTAATPEHRFPRAESAILALAEALDVPRPGAEDPGAPAPRRLSRSPSDFEAGRTSQALAKTELLTPSAAAPETNPGGVSSTGPRGSVAPAVKSRSGLAAAGMVAMTCAGIGAAVLFMVGRDRSEAAVVAPEAAATSKAATTLPAVSPEPTRPTESATPVGDPSTSLTTSETPSPAAAGSASANAAGAPEASPPDPSQSGSKGRAAAPSASAKATGAPAAPRSAASSGAKAGSGSIYVRD